VLDDLHALQLQRFELHLLDLVLAVLHSDVPQHVEAVPRSLFVVGLNITMFLIRLLGTFACDRNASAQAHINRKLRATVSHLPALTKASSFVRYPPPGALANASGGRCLGLAVASVFAMVTLGWLCNAWVGLALELARGTMKAPRHLPPVALADRPNTPPISTYCTCSSGPHNDPPAG